MTLLSIAIPTFNRDKMLFHNLSRLLSYTLSAVEIVVCDNCSLDSTESICKKLALEFKNFKYFRNNKNEGYDKNVLNCIFKSSGEYVWFLGDDDFLEKEHIEKVLRSIKSINPYGILINAAVFAEGSNRVIIENLGRIDQDFIIKCDSNVFIKHIKWSTLISSIIIKRNIIDTAHAKLLVGSCFIQLSIFWYNLYNKDILLIGSSRIIKNDISSTNFGIKNSEIWFVNWIKAVYSLEQVYGKRACKNAATTLYGPLFFSNNSIFLHVFMAKIELKRKKINFDEIIAKLSLNCGYKILLKIIILAPSFLLKTLLLILKAIRNLLNANQNFINHFSRKKF